VVEEMALGTQAMAEGVVVVPVAVEEPARVLTARAAAGWTVVVVG